MKNKSTSFCVASVSRNTNSFGLHGIILVARNGEAFEAAHYQGCSPLTVGAVVVLPRTPLSLRYKILGGPERYEWASGTGLFEIPRSLPDAPRAVVAEVWSKISKPDATNKRTLKVTGTASSIEQVPVRCVS